MTQPQASDSRSAEVTAWIVHLLTASGVVLAFLALAAVESGDERQALLWLTLAIVIDAVDGTLARAARVKERLPWIDGDVLDLVIDYLTYVFIPAALIWRGNYLPQPLAFPLLALVLVSSLYVFARRDMKTADGYFRGFPALWIVVAFYFAVVPVPPGVAAAIVMALIALTFAPIHVIHPFRARDFGRWPMLVTLVGTAATVALFVPGWPESIASSLVAATVAAIAILLVMGLVRTVRGPRDV